MSADLVRRAQDGDTHAFERLVVGRMDRLFATETLILLDRGWGEDSVQVSLVSAWKSLPQLRDPERFDGWLRNVLAHACIDVARRNRHLRRERELRVEIPASGSFEFALAERDALNRAFGSLSVDHRAVFVLRHYLGQTVPELAQTLGIRLGTAKSRLHYAEKAMAAAMDADRTWAVEAGG
jgi:RNA polymerase sigma-70 factor (ECF subfamily)